MAHHDLKSFTEEYEAIDRGFKKAEARFNDRSFQIGDTVTFHDGWPDLNAEGGYHFTGRNTSAVVSWISTYGMQEGFVNLSLDRVGLVIIRYAENFKVE